MHFYCQMPSFLPRVLGRVGCWVCLVCWFFWFAGCVWWLVCSGALVPFWMIIGSQFLVVCSRVGLAGVPGFSLGMLVVLFFTESLILAQDERWRRA